MEGAERATRTQLRLLECWMPLAQAVSHVYNWNTKPVALEALVLAAAPALAQASNTLEAHAILVTYHTRQRSEAL